MRRITALLLCLSLFGCEHHEKDSHTEVFKTPEQATGERREKQMQAHKDLAVSVLHFARPDIEAKPGAGAAVSIAADGLTREIDLSPIEDQMIHHPAEERTILRKHLDEQLRGFDFDRLKAVGFERMKKQVAFELVNGQVMDEMQKSAGTSLMLKGEIVSNVYRVSVIRREGQAAAGGVPITADLTRAWGVKPADVDAAAAQNLRDGLSSASDMFMDTVAFGPVGRTGNLKPGIDPAVILLPEFLTAVRNQWKMRDNLVIFIPSTGGLMFAEQHNQKLLDLLAPQWRKQIATLQNPLCAELLLRTPEQLTYSDFTLTTKPATAPATKPAPYIVH